jgi:CheY-like chemotaxis protein
MATIVLADDEPTIREALGEILDLEGHVVLPASDGLSAQERLMVSRPELIVSDLMMPRMDGLALVRWMRTQPHLRHIPVILMSAIRPPPLEGLEPITFMAKPLDIESLIQAVATAIGRRST